MFFLVLMRSAANSTSSCIFMKSPQSHDASSLRWGKIISKLWPVLASWIRVVDTCPWLKERKTSFIKSHINTVSQERTRGTNGCKLVSHKVKNTHCFAPWWLARASSASSPSKQASGRLCSSRLIPTGCYWLSSKPQSLYLSRASCSMVFFFFASRFVFSFVMCL